MVVISVGIFLFVSFLGRLSSQPSSPPSSQPSALPSVSPTFSTGSCDELNIGRDPLYFLTTIDMMSAIKCATLTDKEIYAVRLAMAKSMGLNCNHVKFDGCSLTKKGISRIRSYSQISMENIIPIQFVVTVAADPDDFTNTNVADEISAILQSRLNGKIVNNEFIPILEKSSISMGASAALYTDTTVTKNATIQETNLSTSSTSSNNLVMVIAIVAAVLVVVVLSFIIWPYYKKRRKVEYAVFGGSTKASTNSVLPVEEIDPTDAFLTHNWGTDVFERDNHERVGHINKLLKASNINTWFDVDRMKLNIREKMAEGIDNTKCVVVFITEKYRDKVNGHEERDNCWIEFNYAVTQVGPQRMIPVVMEAGMRDPKCWKGNLGSALGTKLYIDLAESDPEKFNAGMQHLLRTIKDFTG